MTELAIRSILSDVRNGFRYPSPTLRVDCGWRGTLRVRRRGSAAAVSGEQPPYVTTRFRLWYFSFSTSRLRLAEWRVSLPRLRRFAASEVPRWRARTFRSFSRLDYPCGVVRTLGPAHKEWSRPHRLAYLIGKLQPWLPVARIRFKCDAAVERALPWIVNLSTGEGFWSFP